MEAHVTPPRAVAGPDAFTEIRQAAVSRHAERLKVLGGTAIILTIVATVTFFLLPEHWETARGVASSAVILGLIASVWLMVRETKASNRASALDYERRTRP